MQMPLGGVGGGGRMESRNRGKTEATWVALEKEENNFLR